MFCNAASVRTFTSHFCLIVCHCNVAAVTILPCKSVDIKWYNGRNQHGRANKWKQSEILVLWIVQDFVGLKIETCTWTCDVRSTSFWYMCWIITSILTGAIKHFFFLTWHHIFMSYFTTVVLFVMLSAHNSRSEVCWALCFFCEVYTVCFHCRVKHGGLQTYFSKPKATNGIIFLLRWWIHGLYCWLDRDIWAFAVVFQPQTQQCGHHTCSI